MVRDTKGHSIKAPYSESQLFLTNSSNTGYFAMNIQIIVFLLLNFTNKPDEIFNLTPVSLTKQFSLFNVAHFMIQ